MHETDDAAAVRTYWDAQAATFDHAPDHGLQEAPARTAWADLLRGALPPAPARVADLGCGTGTLAELLLEMGHEVVAVDLSAEMVARARAKTARFGGRARIEQADVVDPPVPAQSVDAVLARHLLWTLPDPVAALRRWVRLVRPGGRLVLVEGVWGTEPSDDAGAADATGAGWGGGVPSAVLAAALEPMVADVAVLQLPQPVFWGHRIEAERYLLRAQVGGS